MEWDKERSERYEELQDKAHQAAAVLPDEAELEKVLHYESALERQLYRAMNQIERLQRRREGENIPAPMALDISAKG